GEYPLKCLTIADVARIDDRYAFASGARSRRRGLQEFGIDAVREPRKPPVGVARPKVALEAGRDQIDAIGAPHRPGLDQRERAADGPADSRWQYVLEGVDEDVANVQVQPRLRASGNPRTERGRHEARGGCEHQVVALAGDVRQRFAREM